MNLSPSLQYVDSDNDGDQLFDEEVRADEEQTSSRHQADSKQTSSREEADINDPEPPRKRPRTDSEEELGIENAVKISLEWVLTRVCHPTIKTEDGTIRQQTMDSAREIIVISSDEE